MADKKLQPLIDAFVAYVNEAHPGGEGVNVRLPGVCNNAVEFHMENYGGSEFDALCRLFAKISHYAAYSEGAAYWRIKPETDTHSSGIAGAYARLLITKDDVLAYEITGRTT
jgi:hypothetical protein